MTAEKRQVTERELLARGVPRHCVSDVLALIVAGVLTLMPPKPKRGRPVQYLEIDHIITAMADRQAKSLPKDRKVSFEAHIRATVTEFWNRTPEADRQRELGECIDKATARICRRMRPSTMQDPDGRIIEDATIPSGFALAYPYLAALVEPRVKKAPPLK
jgi:hypothetical protein